MKTRIAEKYRKQVAPKMQEQFGYKNLLAVPRLHHITVNIGLGRYKDNDKQVAAVVANLERITGQKPIMTKARKSISSFKVREGQIIGTKVTLRGSRMEEFFDKLISVTLPRVRDFRGLSTRAFAKNEKNYTVGLHEHNVFPEVKSDEVEMLHGVEITINTTAKTAPEAQALLTAFGFPFAKKDEEQISMPTKKIKKKKAE